MTNETSFRLADRAAIQDCLCRYARGVDRGDWALVRSTYHPDANDQHGEYRGGVDGFIDWLDKRFAGVDNSMHFLGNCLIEFAGPDHAFVETYFASRRLRPPTDVERVGLQAGDRMCREAWGRYADQFERRDGEWRVARRIVITETSYTSVALGGERSTASASTYGSRDSNDPSYRSREELFARAAGQVRAGGQK
ncbi:nuclear transport factor 2 family protein [Variovorax defluvii]|uniref:Nuclear transport factor 2 family protein n=1 Tax=Variovorax defluvii TaxID=913761 RepID=A0ABP8I8U3_9BURK